MTMKPKTGKIRKGELTISAACARDGIDAKKLEKAARRNAWLDPFAVDEINGELVIMDDLRYADYIKRVKAPWWRRAWYWVLDRFNRNV